MQCLLKILLYTISEGINMILIISLPHAKIKMNKIKNEQIYLNSYCPEGMLKGKKVEMKLNEDDFWESLETHLQMTVFPPFATILRWRG